MVTIKTSRWDLPVQGSAAVTGLAFPWMARGQTKNRAAVLKVLIMASVFIGLSFMPAPADAYSSCSAAPNNCQTGGEWCYTAGAGSCTNRCNSDCPVGGNYTFTGTEFCPNSGSCGPLQRYCQCQFQETTDPDCSSMYGKIFIGDGENCNVKCKSFCGFLAGGCVQQGGEPRACVSANRLVCACGNPNAFEIHSERYSPIVQSAGDAGELHAALVALGIDHMLVRQGKPQLYGTQFHEVDGRLVPEPIQDPEHVDERRAKVGLQPLAEYASLLNELYRKQQDKPLAKAPEVPPNSKP